MAGKKEPEVAPMPDGFSPLLEGGSLILDEGESVTGWITGVDEQGMYFTMIAEGRGLVKLPVSLGLEALKAVIGKPYKLHITCIGDTPTAAGSMKLWRVGAKQEAPKLMLGDGSVELGF